MKAFPGGSSGESGGGIGAAGASPLASPTGNPSVRAPMTSIPEEQEVASNVDPGGTDVVGAPGIRMNANAPPYVPKPRIERNEEE
eukprot:2287195-Prorocentrum_lima.AAC.1